MIKTVSVKSSAINKVTYDTRTQILRIEFKQGSEYDYPGVPEKEFYGLVNASSVGQYFNKHIKAYSIVRR